MVSEVIVMSSQQSSYFMASQDCRCERWRREERIHRTSGTRCKVRKRERAVKGNRQQEREKDKMEKKALGYIFNELISL